MNKQESMEEGLLREAKAGDSTSRGSSSTTAVLVLSTFVAVCGSFCYGCAMGYTSDAQDEIMEDLGVSVGAFSFFGSILTMGGAISAIFSGKVAGLAGRRHTMWLSQGFCTLGWFAIAFAKDVRWLDFGRLWLGIGVGFISYVVPVYIAEITPKDVRGVYTFANQLSQSCGTSLVYIIGNYVHWRTLALIGIIPCVVQLIGLFYIPESTRWLAKCGQEKDFQKALQQLRGKNADISQEVDDIREFTETFEKGQESGFRSLFQRKYARSLTVGIGLMLLQQLSGSAGLGYYASDIFEQAGFSPSIGSTTLAIILIPKALLGMLLVDRLGRRPLLMGSAAGMFLSCILLGFAFSVKEVNYLKELTPILVFVGVLGFFATFAIGLGGLPWIMMSEIFPLHLKVSAGSAVTLANWSTSWVVTYTFNFMLEWSPAGTFFIFSGVCGATILFIWILVPETRGLTLEEIQASLIYSPAVTRI